MRPEEVSWASTGAIAEAVHSGEISAESVIDATLQQITAMDPKLNAFVTVCADDARMAARAIDARRTEGAPLGALAGVPVSLKDIILTAGIRTTAGSRLKETYVPDQDAVVVSRLKAADAIIIGKTTTPEFCHKTVTDSPLTGTTRNPWDLERTPGGSSGGSAVAVAAGMGPVSLGTDGGGSIRLPAALCGVVGFKPTFGLVPQWPAIPGWDLLGHTGPLARCVADIDLTIRVIAGADPHDPDSRVVQVKPPRGKPRVAWARSLDDLEPEPSVQSVLSTVIAAAKRQSARLDEVTLNWSDPDQQFRIIVLSEFAAAFGDKVSSDADRSLMDPGLIQMIEFGQTFKGADLAHALAWKRSFSRRVLTWFQDYDLLIIPTAPVTAFPLGSSGPRMISGRKTSPHAWFNWTWPFNVTGQPALSMPIIADDGLPAGIQIIGRPGEDALVMGFARHLERSLGSPDYPRNLLTSLREVSH
ncbi:amidase [Leptospira interrogans]